MTSLTITAPAKINLNLDVKGKRDDGYHELETVMHKISLADLIYLEKADFTSINSNSNLIPLDNTNLAFKAAQLILSRYGSGEGVKIFIEKRIPIGAGLAGGSTDAAAVLLGINHLFNYNLETKTLAAMALELGSDVPFCLSSSVTAVARGRGEVLTPLPDLHQLHFLLVKPDFQVSTREIFTAFRLEQVEVKPEIDAFIKAWQEFDILNLNKHMVNVLETVSLNRYPQIAIIKRTMQEQGAIRTLMSGSGPTVWGWFTELNSLENAYRYFTKHYQEVFKVSSYVRSE